MNDKTKHHFRVVNSTPEMAERLAEIERASYPTIAADHLITAEQYLEHIRKFPEGQHAIIDENGLAVACASDLRMNMDFNDPAFIQRRCLDMSGHNWMTTHSPQGEWLYGFDISVHPDYRGARLSSMLYKARHNLIRKLNLKGHLAGGNLRGFSKHKSKMDAKTYVNKVVAGELRDEALSAQLKRGFQVVAIIEDFIDDPACDNKAAFIVWHNTDYKT